jgi:ankyrin repeat protein
MSRYPISEFLTAARQGDLARLHELVSTGIPVDIWLKKDQVSALHEALRSRQAHAVKWLLDQGANPNHRAKGGVVVWQLLLYPNQPSHGHSALEYSLLKGLLAKGADVALHDCKGRPPLVCLADLSQLSNYTHRMMDALLAHPDIRLDDTESMTRQTAMAVAVERGHADVAEKLALAGADPWKADGWGQHAVSRAQAHGNHVLAGKLVSLPIRQHLTEGLAAPDSAPPLSRSRSRL